jgi:AcrR family transcriptional regulator
VAARRRGVEVARPRAKRGEGDRLAEEILEAASALLLKTGDEEAVGIRAVAEAVGVTPPSIYLHFEDKEALLLAVCVRQFQRFDAYVESLVAGVDDPADQLRVRAQAYVRFGIEHPEHYRIMFMGRGRMMRTPDGGLEVAIGFDHLLDNVRRSMDAGTMRRDDPLLVATGLWSLVHGITALAIAVPGFPPMGLDPLLDHVNDLVTRGLAPS